MLLDYLKQHYFFELKEQFAMLVLIFHVEQLTIKLVLGRSKIKDTYSNNEQQSFNILTPNTKLLILSLGLL
jgi:hypothetical protein